MKCSVARGSPRGARLSFRQFRSRVVVLSLRCARACFTGDCETIERNAPFLRSERPWKGLRRTARSPYHGERWQEVHLDERPSHILCSHKGSGLGSGNCQCSPQCDDPTSAGKPRLRSGMRSPLPHPAPTQRVSSPRRADRSPYPRLIARIPVRFDTGMPHCSTSLHAQGVVPADARRCAAFPPFVFPC